MEARVSCDEGSFLVTAVDAAVFTVGMMLTEAEEEMLKNSEQRLKCIKSALSRIAYSDISRKNLYRKLRSKYPPKLCEETVELMAERGYIDDERLCRDTVETLYRVRLYGKRKIAAKLYADGFDSETVRNIFDEFEFDSDFENMEKLLMKKYGASAFKARREQKAKICAYLYSQGYGYSEINGIADSFAEDDDE